MLRWSRRNVIHVALVMIAVGVIPASMLMMGITLMVIVLIVNRGISPFFISPMNHKNHIVMYYTPDVTTLSTPRLEAEILWHYHMDAMDAITDADREYWTKLEQEYETRVK